MPRGLKQGDMFTITGLVRLNENEAECTIVVDGAQHRLKVQRVDDLGLEGVNYFDAPKETKRLICFSDYERDFVEQLCRFFSGASLSLPLDLIPHMSSDS